MISGRQKIKLMAMYARPVLIISGLGSISAAMLMIMISIERLRMAVTTGMVLKSVILAIATLLFKMLTSKDQEFFYINLGLHPSRLLRWAILTDLVMYLIICTLIIIIRHGII